jgi:hypothetical protein
MDEKERALFAEVSTLVEHERALRDELADYQDAHRDSDREALRRVEEVLDQCWDLLRQRRALTSVHRDPDEAHVRPVRQVENYLPRSDGRQ